MHQVPARIVLVTGGSRGVGAEVAQRLASPDTHVVVNYREKAERAESIAQAIRNAGGHASTLRADISDEIQCAAMIDTIAARFGRLDALILNASVGLELGVDLGYAKRVNRDAQRRLALRAVPLMPAGGTHRFRHQPRGPLLPPSGCAEGTDGRSPRASGRAKPRCTRCARNSAAPVCISPLFPAMRSTRPSPGRSSPPPTPRIRPASSTSVAPIRS